MLDRTGWDFTSTALLGLWNYWSSRETYIQTGNSGNNYWRTNKQINLDVTNYNA
jgi:hypothetical protein